MYYIRFYMFRIVQRAPDNQLNVRHKNGCYQYDQQLAPPFRFVMWRGVQMRNDIIAKTDHRLSASVIICRRGFDLMHQYSAMIALSLQHCTEFFFANVLFILEDIWYMKHLKPPSSRLNNSRTSIILERARGRHRLAYHQQEYRNLPQKSNGK